MELYDKLTKIYTPEHFSLSNTQTVIEEDEKGAATREVIIEHIGVDILKINKSGTGLRHRASIVRLNPVTTTQLLVKQR